MKEVRSGEERSYELNHARLLNLVARRRQRICGTSSLATLPYVM